MDTYKYIIVCYHYYIFIYWLFMLNKEICMPLGEVARGSNMKEETKALKSKFKFITEIKSKKT